MRMQPNVGRNNPVLSEVEGQRALRRMGWCNALRLLHPTWLNAQARELEQTIALNVAEILKA